uniref:Uncharacterized protein n=1 Tax=Moniliophthora roreri TaxID=221103 RepID=A0A0W0G887_MONRR
MERTGIKPFIVHLSDGYRMNRNTSCKVLPPRGGSPPVKHALTYFHQVRLPASALLGTPQRAGRSCTMCTGLRGGAIAEGDVLVTSIRFGIEIITRRIQSPPTTDPTSLLYRYEQAVIAALRQLLSLSATDAGDRHIRHILDFFVASVMKLDPAWHTESAGISQRDQLRIKVDCAMALLPELGSLLKRLDMQECVTALIVSDQSWDASLQTFGDEEHQELRHSSHLQCQL